MIAVHGLTKEYGEQTLFKDVSFSIARKERVGLVGRNGYGKSTLFRIILGEETPDAGHVTIPRNYRIGHLSQHITFTQKTVRDEVALGLPEMEKDALWKVDQVLTGLGFTVDDVEEPLSMFSGGYQMRILLAKTLIAEPDMLLLDEPTNFLDIISIRWLERFLAAWRGEMIVVTHDRKFMDSVVTQVMGIHRQTVRKVAGTTAAYYEQNALEEEVYEKSRVNQEKRIKQMTAFVTKFRAKARQANLAQSRLKALAKIQPKEKLHAIETLSFSFPLAEVPNKTVLRVEDLSFSYDGAEPYLINALRFFIDVGDKVCIIGQNGRGKTTLIKLLAGALTPCAGTIKRNPHCRIAYYEQAHTASLNPAFTIEEELMAASEVGGVSLVRNICGAMMFSGDMALKKISVLSGGEKCRVLLGKLLVARHNVLLLDEPTHHLDMESCDAIIDAVQKFEGVSIVVTHDERFLDRAANKLIVCKKDSMQLFPGTYQEFLEQVGWDDEDGSPSSRGGKIVKKTKKRQSKQERARFVQERAQTLKPYTTKITQLEKTISEEEQRCQEKNTALLEASTAGDSPQIQTLSKELHEAQQNVDRLYEELAQTTHDYEALVKDFDRQEEE